MKGNHKRFLNMFLCLILWFSLFISIQGTFLSAQSKHDPVYPVEIEFVGLSDGDTIIPNENGNVLIKAEYTGSECPYYFEIFIDGTRRTQQYTPGLCKRSISYYWPALEEFEGSHSLHAYVTYQGGTVIAESEIIWVNLDNPEEPQIQITDPSGAEPVGNGVNITAKVTIDSTYYYDTRVDYYIDGNYIGSEGNPTSQVGNILYYTYYWDSTSVSDGQHTISARVVDQFSRKNEDSVVVTVQQDIDNQSPIACFSYNPHDPDVGQIIDFDASCSSDPDGNYPLDYSWSFGDGAAGSGVLISHSYSSEGTYHVRLTVIDSKGASDYIIRNVTVSSGGGNQHPTACFTYDPLNPEVDQIVNFDASCSSDPDNDPLDYSWNFGDGYSGSGVTVSHSYSSEGIYQVTLTVTDDHGAFDSTMANISVSDSGGNHSPTACFTRDPLNPEVDQIVNFDASCSSDPDNDPLDYSWNFGDGETGTGKYVSHSYSSSGSYLVTLTVNDGNGGIDSISKTLEVDQPDQFSLTISAPSTVVADGKSSGITISVSISTTVEVKVLPSSIYDITESDPGSIYNLGDEGLPILDGNKSKWEGYILNSKSIKMTHPPILGHHYIIVKATDPTTGKKVCRERVFDVQWYNQDMVIVTDPRRMGQVATIVPPIFENMFHLGYYETGDPSTLFESLFEFAKKNLAMVYFIDFKSSNSDYSINENVQNYWEAFSEKDFGYFNVHWKKDDKKKDRGYEIPDEIMSAKKQAFQIAFNHCKELYEEYNIGYILILGPYEVFPSYLVQAHLESHYHNVFSDTVLGDFEGTPGHVSNYLNWVHDFKAEAAVGRIVAYTFEEYSHILSTVGDNSESVEEGLFLNTEYDLPPEGYHQAEVYAKISVILTKHGCGTTILTENSAGIGWDGSLDDYVSLYINQSDLVFVGDHGSPRGVGPFWFAMVSDWGNDHDNSFNFNRNILFVCSGCSVGKFNTLYDGEQHGLLSPSNLDGFLTYATIHTLLVHNGIGFFAPSCYNYPGAGKTTFGSEYLMLDLVERIPDYRIGEAFIRAKKNYIENVEFWWWIDTQARKKAIVVASYNFFGNPKMRLAFNKKNENQLEDTNQCEEINKQMQPLAFTNISEVESLQERAKQLLQQALNNELNVIEAQALIEKADELLADAERLYLSGNYVAANNLALQSMNLYQQAIRILQDLLS